MVTPWLNQHAVGSGIIASYFVGTAAIALIVTVLVSGHIQLPDPWVLLAGMLFGAGVLSVQKATERAPEPAIAIAIPSSRAFLTAILAFLVLGFTTSFPLGISYAVQLGLCIALVAIVHVYNPRNEPTPWSMYAGIATVLLSVSDIILKYSGSFDTVFGDTSWFAIAGSIIPLVMNYTKTGTFIPTFREKGTVDPVIWWTTLGVMVCVFYLRVVTQVLSVSLAPNPALPHIIGSFAVPAVAFLAWNTGRYRVTIHEIVVLALMTFTSLTSGYIAYQL
jgi:multidrug transporter EmrE-like cation transporter